MGTDTIVPTQTEKDIAFSSITGVAKAKGVVMTKEVLALIEHTANVQAHLMAAERVSTRALHEATKRGAFAASQGGV